MQQNQRKYIHLRHKLYEISRCRGMFDLLYDYERDDKIKMTECNERCLICLVVPLFPLPTHNAISYFYPVEINLHLFLFHSSNIASYAMTLQSEQLFSLLLHLFNRPCRIRFNLHHALKPTLFYHNQHNI